MAKKNQTTDEVAGDAPADDLSALLDTVTVQIHSRHLQSADQYEILVGRRRIGYVCVGEARPGGLMPINLLSPATLELNLTQREKIAIAKRVRELMAPINVAEAVEAVELRELANEV